MGRKIIVLVIILMLALCPTARASNISKIRIVEYGIFETRVEKTVDAKGTSLGRVDILDNSLKNTKKTNVIEAAVGTNFGIRYVVEGNPNGDEVKLLVKVIHPNTINPETNQITTIEQVTVFPKIGELSYAGMGFEEAWELSPGEWIFQLWSADQKLAEQSFTVRLRK